MSATKKCGGYNNDTTAGGPNDCPLCATSYNVSNLTFSRIVRDSNFFVCNKKLSNVAQIS